MGALLGIAPEKCGRQIMMENSRYDRKMRHAYNLGGGENTTYYSVVEGHVLVQGIRIFSFPESVYQHGSDHTFDMERSG